MLGTYADYNHLMKDQGCTMWVKNVPFKILQQLNNLICGLQLIIIMHDYVSLPSTSVFADISIAVIPVFAQICTTSIHFYTGFYISKSWYLFL